MQASPLAFPCDKQNPAPSEPRWSIRTAGDKRRAVNHLRLSPPNNTQAIRRLASGKSTLDLPSRSTHGQLAVKGLETALECLPASAPHQRPDVLTREAVSGRPVIPARGVSSSRQRWLLTGGRHGERCVRAVTCRLLLREAKVSPRPPGGWIRPPRFF